MNLISFLVRIWAILFFLNCPIVFCSNKIPDFSLTRDVLEDENFLWKRMLVIDDGKSGISFEENHEELYTQINTFRFNLSLLERENIVEFVHDILQTNSGLSHLQEIFMDLNHEGQKISDILKLKEEKDILDISKIETTRSILNNNLKRLEKCNTCIASLEYISENGDRKKIPVIMPKSKKPVIFFSGIGNELIRILEHSPLFHDFEFVIFHHEKTNDNSIEVEHFRTILESLYVNVASLLDSQSLTPRIKTDVLKLSVAQDNIKTEKAFTQKNIDAYLKNLDSDKEMERYVLEIPQKIMNTKKAYLDAYKDFKYKFCDSEQALRYFLFAHIDTLLEGTDLTAKGTIMLHAHSEMDPCKRCTNALFLECGLLSHHEGFQTSTKKKEKLPLGFFQKLYSKQKANMPGVFIFVSSQGPESEGGIGRRLTSLNFTGSQLNEKINPAGNARLFFRYNVSLEEDRVLLTPKIESSVIIESQQKEEMRKKFLETVSQRYIQGIRNANSQNGAVLWGGDIELIEIANLHNLNITVYQYSLNSTKKIKKDSSQKLVIEANPPIGPQDGKPINLWLNNLHYQNYDPINQKVRNVPGDGNCLFHAVLRAMTELNQSTTLLEVSQLRNQVADRLNALVNDINQGKEVERSGTEQTNWQPFKIQLTQNDNPIYSRFAAIFEAENEIQLRNAISYLPLSKLLEEARQLRN